MGLNFDHFRAGLALALVLAVGGASDRVRGAEADEPDALAGRSVARDIVLGPGDTIQVVSLKSEEISKEWRIGESGRLHLPLIGAMEVAGKRAADLEQELNKAYSEYIIDPQINVFVTAVRSRPVTVIGAVKQPGAQQLEGPTTLFEILQKAGGTTELAERIVIVRDSRWGLDGLPRVKLLPDGKVQAELPIEAAFQGHGPGSSVPIRPFDVINVELKRERLVFIAGEVNRPGAIVLDTADGVPLSKALVLAGGYKASGAYNHTYLWRAGESSDGGSVELNVRDIIKGKSEDIVLREGDYLIIPPRGGVLSNMQGLSTALAMATSVAIILGRL